MNLRQLTAQRIIERVMEAPGSYCVCDACNSILRGSGNGVCENCNGYRLDHGVQRVITQARVLAAKEADGVTRGDLDAY